jgi:mono/diheme cytochrome c family protein
MRRQVVSGGAALVAVLALVGAGCGSTEITATPETVIGTLPEDTGAAIEVPAGDAAAGAAVFESGGCGGCHTLAAAGTNGTVGPNLDETKPDAEAAYTQILNGGGGMPPYKDQLSEQQIADVTAYVVESTSG